MSDDDFIYVPREVPVFPLPQVVLFPGTIIPLHVFEPRYREMMADAVAGSGVIALALLKPGFEPLYYTRRAPIHETIGVAQIMQHEQVADGNYNILVRGIARARIVEEGGEHLYRVARIEPVYTFCSSGEQRSDELREALGEAIRDNDGVEPDLRQHWLRLFDVQLDLDDLTDLLAAGLPADAELRQCLLEEPDAISRAEILLEQMRTLAAMAHTRRKLGGDGLSGMN